MSETDLIKKSVTAGDYAPGMVTKAYRSMQDQTAFIRRMRAADPLIDGESAARIYRVLWNEAQAAKSKDDDESAACFPNEYSMKLATRSLMISGDDDGSMYLVAQSIIECYQTALHSMRMPVLRHVEKCIEKYDVYFVLTFEPAVITHGF